MKASDFAKPGDFRSHTPRFQGENLANNLILAQQLETLAEAKGVTAAQLAIAWALSRGTDIIPLVGTKNRKRLGDALAALEIKLSAEELGRIEAAVPASAVAGTRYDARQMQMLDSERRSA
jgi:aryl-alcohol dehydrogenase-like predicted oxidoreductase